MIVSSYPRCAQMSMPGRRDRQSGQESEGSLRTHEVIGTVQVSVLFVPYLLPTRDLQIAEFPSHDTLNSINTYLIGV